jgi:hypothetical protein
MALLFFSLLSRGFLKIFSKVVVAWREAKLLVKTISAYRLGEGISPHLGKDL